MKKILNLLILTSIYSSVQAQRQDCSVVLNHILITVDSTTYQAILKSELVNSNFAFAYERNKNWEGIYMIGKDNYIEIFHPNSIPNNPIPIGNTWICQTSLVANCIENYELPDNKQIDYSLNESFDELSVNTLDPIYMQDSSNLMTTWEMNKFQYESWTKKTYNDSLIFKTTDYNSISESDSSKNYSFNNITGIQIKLNLKDSSNIVQYLNLIGYTIKSNAQNKMKLSNSIDFIELDFSKNVEFATISTLYFELNKPTKLKHITLGNTEIVITGNVGKWEINK